MTETDTIVESKPIADGLTERLHRAAREAASSDVVLRPSVPSEFFTRVHAARHALMRLETQLARTRVAPAGPASSLDPASETLSELRANYRHLRAALAAVSNSRRRIDRLPRILPDEKTSSRRIVVPRIAIVAESYLGAVDGSFSPHTFCHFIGSLQLNESLTVNELWQIPAFLKFSLLETVLAEIDPRSLSRARSSISDQLKSLRAVANADWEAILEPLIVFDGVLRRDPASSYASMDFASREFYRKRIAFIARHADRTETGVAEEALRMAQRGADDSVTDPRIRRRQSHVGYYILDKGFDRLARRVGFHPPVSWRIRQFIRSDAESFYIDGILLLTVFLIAAALFPALVNFSSVLAVLTAVVFLLLPATQGAVDLINHSITAFFEPDVLPKLDFSKGIPSECATLVAVPSLLLHQEQVRKLVNDLEVRYLANRGRNLHFVLLTDLPDSISQPHERDSDPLAELAVRLIDELNAKYASSGDSPFLLLHRHRIFNVRQGVWMGWERKRGKLLDLNKLLTGDYDAFPIKAGNIASLRSVRYILTLDSDTQLPHGAAAQLAGAIAHPLNQAIIDPERRIVTAGYGILQPRIGVTVQSAVRSRLASIYSGQNGFDIYTHAISDAYQDLFGEGIFTGKGIYEVSTLHAVLDARFPRNSLLSHDLIEGAYARAGLTTDVELIEDYPSHYSAYAHRQHRWVRGDWQIAQWIFSHVPDESGCLVDNPISAINRWKICDNLRRSLVDPFLFMLFIAGWLGLPGGPLYWTIVPLLLLIFPSVAQLVLGLGKQITGEKNTGASDALFGFARALLVALLYLVLLPHKMLLAFDAIVRSLIRRLITGRLLLEWETAAQAEVFAGRRAALDRYLVFTPVITFGVTALIWFFAPHRIVLLYAAPILLLWLLGVAVTPWLNRPPRRRKPLAENDREFLLMHALRIWRYFHQFGAEEHNYLIPDNVEEEGLIEAARVSPTNIGLLLNARQAACELGFTTVPEFAGLTRNTLETIARLEKFRGHLYNWYNTKTLEPLNSAPFVSSVDSGNLVASLYTLHAGALDTARKPLFAPALLSGLHAHWRLLRSQSNSRAHIARLSPPTAGASLESRLEWLSSAEAALAADISSSSMPQMSDRWWFVETQNRIVKIRELIAQYMPWIQPDYRPLRAALDLDAEICGAQSIEDAIQCAELLSIRLAPAQEASTVHIELPELSQKLYASLAEAIGRLRALASDLRLIAQVAERLGQETEFAFLADPYRQILSIGYDVHTHQLHEACYDMIASEARIATFLAIARGDLPYQSWFKLSRDHVRSFGRFLLLSWSGTMFEYLMPALWMRSYQGTLIANTQAASVQVQRAFAADLHLPWGISESGGATRNDAGHYHYQAYGIPPVSLWSEATAGPVISPYSTFLALSEDAPLALRNLRHMSSLHWIGAYGFYEAADYTASRRTPALVREWMAHHHGMSLLAIVNLLSENIVQQWFHANPLVQATELLLHEMLPGKATMRARLKEFSPLSS